MRMTLATTGVLAALGAVAGCGEAVGEAAGRAADSAASAGAESINRSLQQSTLVRNAQAAVQGKLDRGLTRADLRAAVEKSRQAGQTSAASACVQKQFIASISLSNAVIACRGELLRELGASLN